MKTDKKPQPSRQASLKIIAEQTGLSMMTVSRTLRGMNSVAPETAAKIRKVAESLRYRPNKLVEGLRTGRTGMIAAVLPTTLGFYEAALRSIESSLDKLGCSLILNMVSKDYGQDAMREELRRLHRCIDLRVDGVILRPVNDDANAVYFTEVVERGMPLVVIDRKLPDFDCDFVGSEDRGGGAAAAHKLLSLGCRNLALLHAGARISTSRERREGFLAEAQGSGASVCELDCGGFRADTGSLTDFFQSSAAQSVDGIFAVGDLLARDALQVLRNLGRQCPRDFKVLGFGHLLQNDPAAIRLATFDQHPSQIGEEAVRLLMDRLDNPGKPPRSVLLPAAFVAGDTL